MTEKSGLTGAGQLIVLPVAGANVKAALVGSPSRLKPIPSFARATGRARDKSAASELKQPRRAVHADISRRDALVGAAAVFSGWTMQRNAIPERVVIVDGWVVKQSEVR